MKWEPSPTKPYQRPVSPQVTLRGLWQRHLIQPLWPLTLLRASVTLIQSKWFTKAQIQRVATSPFQSVPLQFRPGRSKQCDGILHHNGVWTVNPPSLPTHLSSSLLCHCNNWLKSLLKTIAPTNLISHHSKHQSSVKQLTGLEPTAPPRQFSC